MKIQKCVKHILQIALLIVLSGSITSCVSNNQSPKTTFAPNPARHPGGVIQVYSARTWGAKQAVSVHTWISTKRSDEDHYTSYEIIGWKLYRSNSALVIRTDKPDRDWWGHPPKLLLDYRKADVDDVIDKIAAAVDQYPYKDNYQAWPGPNSNTFTAFVGRQVSELGLDLPSTAIGKDYRAFSDSFGISASGTGVQASLLGLLGVTIGYEEGLEFNILGLSFELDLKDFALELPGVGRIGPPQATVEKPKGL